MKAWISLRFYIVTLLVITANMAIFAQISGDVSQTGRVFEGPSRAIDTRGAMCYYGDGSEFVIASIMESGKIKEFSRLTLEAAPLKIMVEAGYAYLACGQAGLAVIDITIPKSPLLVGSLSLDKPVNFLTVMNNHVYLSTGDGGIKVVSMNEPDVPSVVATVPAMDFIDDVVGQDNIFYASDGFGRIRIFDASQPDSPIELSTEFFNTRPSLLALKGNTLFAIDRFNLSIIDIADPHTPNLYIRLPHNADAAAVSVQENTLYLSDVNKQLHVFDVSTPINPTVQEIIELDDNAVALHSNGKFLFAAQENRNMLTYAISEPGVTAFRSEIETGGYASDIHIIDDRLILTGARTRVMDISVPANPVEIGRNYVSSRINALSEDGNHLFIADNDDTLRVFNINSPDDPKPVGYYEGPGQVAFAEVNDHILFLARPYVVRLLDVHDPMTPLEISTYSTGVPFALTAIGVHEETMYLGFSNGDIRVVDISDPTQPQDRGRYRDFGSEPVDFAFDNDLIYAAYLDRGLTIFRQGFGPIPWANIPSLDETKGVAVKGQLVYMADGEAGLRIMEVKSPEQIREAASFKSGSSASRLAVSGDRVFLGDELAGVFILQTDFTLQSQAANKATSANTFDLKPAYPNPFNPATTIRFELTSSQRIDISVYNVLGQEVRTIAAGTFESGIHQMQWHGLDNTGSRVSSGIYFLRVQSNHQVTTQRLMLLK